MRAKLMATILGLLTLLATIVLLGQPVHAAEISTTGLTGSEATVTDRYGNVVTDPSDLSKWENFKISYDWTIPNGQKIEAGDTATVALPGNTVASSNMSFELRDDTGAVIGTFTIAAGESVGKITFTEHLTENVDRHGTLNFYAKGTTSDDNWHGDWALNKIGWVSGYDENGLPATLTWNVAFNPNGGDIGQAVVTDTIGPNQTFVPGSVVAHAGSYNAKGEFIASGAALEPTVTVSGKQVILTFENVTTAVNLTYQVKLANVTGAGDAWANSASMNGSVVSGQVTWGGNGTGNGGTGGDGGDGGDEGALGAVLLQKTDAKTGAALAGAEYSLIDAKGQVIKAGLTTNAAGKLFIDELEDGDYSLIETKAPAGYELNTKPLNFSVTTTGTTQMIDLTQTDEPTVVPPKTGDFTLVKTAAGSHEKLAGAVYELRDATGKIVKTDLTTDAQGELTVTGLTPGDYTVVETKAPAGYELAKEPLKVTIVADQTTPLTVTATDTETPVIDTKGAVCLTKTAATTGEKLAGAKYELQTATGEVLQSGLTTDSQGQITVHELTAGEYRFVETTAPEGYELNKTPLDFTIKAGQTATVNVEAIDPAKVVEPPVEPGKPEPPVEPGKPEPPVEPGKPEPPVEPGKPEPPVEPGKPEPPVKPVTPTTPKPPVAPTKPLEPSLPTAPVNPGTNGNGSTAPQTGGNATGTPNNSGSTAISGTPGTVSGLPANEIANGGTLPQTNEKSQPNDEILASVAGVSIMMIIFAIGSWDWRRNRY